MSTTKPTNSLNKAQLFYYWSVPFFTIFSFLIAVYGLYQVVLVQQENKEFYKELKTIDLMSSFQNRYDDIMHTSKKLSNEGILDGVIYYERFWNLQLEQWQYFNKGYVDCSTYSYWMLCRYREWIKNDSVGGITFQDGFKLGLSGLEAPKFKSFMSTVFENYSYTKTYCADMKLKDELITR